MELFSPSQIVGVFRGFREGGMEFQADLALPYRSDFQRIPMHGQFLLVQLETPDEAVLGRIAALSSEGRLAFGSGEEFNIRAVQERREIPEDLREQYLRYKITIRVLGVLRRSGGGLTFVPSHRRLPHVGSAVAFPSGALLQELCGHTQTGALIGHFALGEYVFGAPGTALPDGYQLRTPEIGIRFPVGNLAARRSFIFARAGFGKSNLNKLLFSELYRTTPTVEKRGGRQVPVGTIIFDPDGEYFWPDDKGRPGLCDVEHLQDRLVVFTQRQAPSAFYGSFVVPQTKLDIRQLRPADVISIALPLERQDQQNIAKLKGATDAKWRELVNLAYEQGNHADLKQFAALLGIDAARSEVEAVAARSNLTTIVRMLHDPGSLFLDLLLKALRDGKICVVDISQMRGQQGFTLAGIILRRIFDRNQEEFTKAQPETIPTIAVVEEAQAVLNGRDAAAEPFVAWVKEGRKYDLGALLVTQQPGSIPVEILSQGDNWFIFHLLSAADLFTLKQANAHFSEDILSSLLNEPIPGQGVFWSSVAGKPYPVPLRALSFEAAHRCRDPDCVGGTVETYAVSLRRQGEAAIQPRELLPVGGSARVEEEPVTQRVDLDAQLVRDAARALAADPKVVRLIDTPEGVAWGRLKGVILANLPTLLDDRDQRAFRLVQPALTTWLGPEGEGWHSTRLGGRTVVRRGPDPGR